MSKREDAGGKMRTTAWATKHERKSNTLQKSFDYRQDIVTTTLYCVCKDCIKYCNYRKPVMCIDPYLMDMRHTYWIYHGLVMASKTERAISIKVPDTIPEIPEENEEDATGN